MNGGPGPSSFLRMSTFWALPPFVQDATFVQMGSQPPLDRSQHFCFMGTPSPTLTAQTCLSPMVPIAAVQPVIPDIRRMS